MNTGGTTVASNPISIGSASGTGVYASAGSNLSLGGVVSGGQLVKSGAGDVTLTGANTFTARRLRRAFCDSTPKPISADPAISSSTADRWEARAPPSGTAIDRNLVLLGAGGVDVGNTLLDLERPDFRERPVRQERPRRPGADRSQYLFRRHKGRRRTTFGRSGRGTGKGGNRRQYRGRRFRASETFTTSRPFSLTTANGVEPYIEVVDAKTLTVNGTVSGGALHKDGDGTLVLNGANTYSKTYIEQGQVVGNSTSIRGDIVFSTKATPCPRSGSTKGQPEHSAAISLAAAPSSRRATAC